MFRLRASTKHLPKARTWRGTMETHGVSPSRNPRRDEFLRPRQFFEASGSKATHTKKKTHKDLIVETRKQNMATNRVARAPIRVIPCAQGATLWGCFSPEVFGPFWAAPGGEAGPTCSPNASLFGYNVSPESLPWRPDWWQLFVFAFRQKSLGAYSL